MLHKRLRAILSMLKSAWDIVQVGSIRGGSIAFRRGMLTMTVRLEEVERL